MNIRQQKVKKISLITIVIGLVIILIFYLSNKTNKSPDLVTGKVSSGDNTPKPSLTVTTVNPLKTIIHKHLSANGNISAWQESSISSEVNGLLLTEVLVSLGDQIKRGQLLAKFSASTIDADLSQMNANVAEANATLLEAESNASRARSIQDTGALSNQQIEQYLTLAVSAKARLKAAQAILQVQSIKLKQTSVISPDDGVISLAPATVGTVYSPGQELFRLIRKSRIEWRADLTSADISQVKVGMKVQITLPDGGVADGTVRSISPIVDTKTRNGIVFVDIPAGSAKTGMFARGKFIIGETHSLTLPNEAIVMRDGFSYIMQVENNKIKQTKVQLGQRNGEIVELLNFDDTQASIVESGGAFLADGDNVKVVEKVVQKAAE